MEEYDVAIVGGGVSGTSLLYALSNYTDIDSITLLEQYDEVAPLNSDSEHNSQTLHRGDIETNYDREKAEHVRDAADMVVGYGEDHDDILHPLEKMVLGVGEDEVEELEQRYEDIQDLYPELETIGRDEIAEHEPALVEGRDEDEELLALYTEDGHAVDYGRLAESLAADATDSDDVTLSTGTPVEGIEELEDGYRLDTGEDTITADAVAVTAGTYSLDIAQELGYGEQFAQLPVTGGFYFGPEDLELDTKVYTVQDEKLPFAAVHGDPDVDEDGQVRFGPTAMPIASKEWTKTSVPDFLHPSNIDTGTVRDLLDTEVVRTLGRTLWDRDVASFMARNLAYQLPGGDHLFLEDARKIVPDLEAEDISYATDKGGVRPQIIDREDNELLLGEAKIDGDDILFNMTPSPGATNCLANAMEDARTVAGYLDATFDQAAYQDDHQRSMD